MFFEGRVLHRFDERSERPGTFFATKDSAMNPLIHFAQSTIKATALSRSNCSQLYIQHFTGNGAGM
jgi:hypothetical protein